MDPYINLTPVSPTAIAMGQSPTRTHNQQQKQQQQQQQQQQQILLPEQVRPPGVPAQRAVGLITHLQEMQRQMDEYNRSVTIIIWYKVRKQIQRRVQGPGRVGRGRSVSWLRIF